MVSTTFEISLSNLNFCHLCHILCHLDHFDDKFSKSMVIFIISMFELGSVQDLTQFEEISIFR